MGWLGLGRIGLVRAAFDWVGLGCIGVGFSAIHALTHARARAGMHAGTHACQVGEVAGSCGEPTATVVADSCLLTPPGAVISKRTLVHATWSAGNTCSGAFFRAPLGHPFGLALYRGFILWELAPSSKPQELLDKLRFPFRSFVAMGRCA